MALYLAKLSFYTIYSGMPAPKKAIRSQRLSPTDPRQRVKFFDHDGWFTTDYTSPREAKAYAERNKATLLAKKEKGLTFGNLSRGFFDRGGEWEKNQVAHGWTRTDNTLAQYSVFLRVNFLPVWEKRDIRTLDAEEIEKDLLNFKKNPGKLRISERGKGELPYSLATLSKMLYALGLMFRFWVKKGYITENPVSKIERFNDEPERPRKAIPADMRKVLRPETHEQAVALYGSPMHSAFFFLIDDTGARPGELRALIWAKINWEKRFFPIKTAIEAGKRDKLKDPKAGSFRPAYFSKRTKEELLAWRAASPHFDDMDYIFIVPDHDKPIASNTALYALRRSLTRVSIDWHDWAPYNFRHSFATRKKATLTQKEIGTMLGHTNEETTRGYQHPDDDELYESGKDIKTKLDLSFD